MSAPCSVAPGPGAPPSVAAAAFARKLRAKPGKWYRYPQRLTKATTHTYAYSIRHHMHWMPPVALTGGGFDAEVHEGALYVKAQLRKVQG